MGERIRSFDWSATALGAIDDWSPALVGNVRTMLAAETEMALLWGPAHIFLYNDRYAAALGDRHPGALGGSAREIWAEDWGRLGPALARVSGGASISGRERPAETRRDGRSIEVFLDISLSPVLRR